MGKAQEATAWPAYLVIGVVLWTRLLHAWVLEFVPQDGTDTGLWCCDVMQISQAHFQGP